MPNPLLSAEDLIALSLVAGAGRKTLYRAIQMATRHACPLGQLIGRSPAALLRMAVPGEEAAAEALSKCGDAERDRAVWQLQVAKEDQIRVRTAADPAYPAHLARCLGEQAPPVLFYKGNEALLDAPGAGIVGTRKPTGEASQLAARAARLFAKEAIPVVSGGAAGIDLAAHEAALKADGATVVVLPEGLHATEPPPMLRSGLEQGQVLLLSEFLPTDGWQTHRAMTRNRTIAACSALVCVIEPREKGGSMFTAEQALAGGKPVFYWGGACRDGALRDKAGAFRLADARGRLPGSALIQAAQPVNIAPPGQGSLFDLER